MLALPPAGWPKMPQALIQAGIFVGLILSVIGLALTVIGFLPDLHTRPIPILFILSGLSFVVIGIAWLVLIKPSYNDNGTSKSETSAPPVALQTVEELFKSDFVGRNIARNNQYANIEGPDPVSGLQVTRAQVPVAYILDLNAGSHYVAFYIPKDQDDYQIGQWISANYKRLVTQWFAGVKITGKALGDSKAPGATKFSGRIYIYHEDPLSPQALGRLTSKFAKSGADVTFRSTDYTVARYAETMLLASKVTEPTAAANEDGEPAKRIVVDCQPSDLPSRLPVSGVLNSLIVPPKPLSGGSQGMGGAYGPPGSPLKWPEGQGLIYRCSIQNLAAEPLIGLSIKLELIIAPAGHSTFGPGSKFYGEEVKTVATEILIDRIDSGKDQAFVFYVMNYSNKSAQFVFPDSASSKSLTKPGKRTASAVIYSQPVPIHLPPSKVYPEQQ
jgi:hypothetical protein